MSRAGQGWSSPSPAVGAPEAVLRVGAAVI
jgi:hypothetical protein